MRDRLILTIPEHIAALPEPEQGQALVAEIHERKRLHNIRERFFQQLVWGDVDTDGHGNAIPRELPEHWQSLREAAVSGGGVEYTRSLNKPDVLAVRGKRELMTHQTGIRSGGNRAGKVAAQIEDTRVAICWLDEHVRFLVEGWQDPYQGVRDLVVRTPWAEPSTVPDVASAHWACESPTGQPGMTAIEARMAEYARGIADGLASRPYNRKLIK